MDKGSILYAKDGEYYIYGLLLGIPANGEHLSPADFSFLSFDDSEVRDLLFDSVKNFANAYCSLIKAPMLFSVFRSRTKLSTQAVIKGFQKYSLFLTFDVENNKVHNKRLLSEHECYWYQRTLLTKGRMLVEDSGLDINLLYIKSCLSEQKNYNFLLSLDDYKKELLPTLKKLRDLKYEGLLENYVEENLEQMIQNITSWTDGAEPFNSKYYDLRDSTIYLVQANETFYLFLNITADRYVQIGRINLNKSSEHNIGYFLALVHSHDDFIMQEVYKPVKHHFSAFLDKNSKKIDGIVPLYGIVVDDLDIHDSRLKLNKKDFEVLRQYYGIVDNGEVDE